MTVSESQAFESGNPVIAGPITTDQIPLAADTYYVGMPLEFDGANSRYQYITSFANIAAIYNGEDATAKTAGEYADAIMGGDVMEAGIVDGTGAAITLTEANIAAMSAAGFFVKRS